jgi:hypothetical protein
LKVVAHPIVVAVALGLLGPAALEEEERVSLDAEARENGDFSSMVSDTVETQVEDNRPWQTLDLR